MNQNQKKQLLLDLIHMRQRLVWSAQTSKQSVQEYGYEMTRLLNSYQNAGKIAQIELFEVVEDCRKREEIAIYGYITGLNQELKRYTCEPDIYKTLYQAICHVEKINRNLLDLKKLKRLSLVETK